jgi:hypothetical protein
MKELHLHIEEVIGLQVQEIAEWRWRKAEEFPDDPRNLEAAKELERLAAEIARLNGSPLHNRILELIDIVSEQGADDEAIDTIESTEAELHRVGFGGGFRTGAELLERYRNELEDRLRESIDDVDDAQARCDQCRRLDRRDDVQPDASDDEAHRKSGQTGGKAAKERCEKK